MCHHDGFLAELHEFGQDLLNPGRIEHHVILDGRQLLNIIRDRHLRIDEGRKTLRDSSVHHLDGTDLNDLILIRRKSGCLQVKYDIAVI